MGDDDKMNRKAGTVDVLLAPHEIWPWLRRRDGAGGGNVATANLRCIAFTIAHGFLCRIWNWKSRGLRARDGRRECER